MQLQDTQHGLDQQRERPQRRPLLLAAHQPPGRPDAPVIVDAHVHVHVPQSRALQQCTQRSAPNDIAHGKYQPLDCSHYVIVRSNADAMLMHIIQAALSSLHRKT